MSSRYLGIWVVELKQTLFFHLILRKILRKNRKNANIFLFIRVVFCFKNINDWFGVFWHNNCRKCRNHHTVWSIPLNVSNFKKGVSFLSSSWQLFRFFCTERNIFSWATIETLLNIFCIRFWGTNIYNILLLKIVFLQRFEFIIHLQVMSEK
jgi:hypothetical protein